MSESTSASVHGSQTADRQDDRQRRPVISREHLAFYEEGQVETGNGHEMRYGIDRFGTGPDRRTHYLITVVDPDGVVVGYSRSDDVDLAAERELTLDYLLEGR